MSSKQLSAGVLIINEFNEILLGHATGQIHWDIPKGKIEDGEYPVDAAIRELKEEFSIDAQNVAITFIDLGKHLYTKYKDLYLFLCMVSKCRIDQNALHCTSMFIDKKTNETLPEIDAYKWVSLQDTKTLTSHCTSGMIGVLANLYVFGSSENHKY